MSDAFVLGRAAAFLTTPFCGVSLASKEVRKEVFAHVEVVKFTRRSRVPAAAIAMVVKECLNMMTLNLKSCHGFTALPGRIGDCAALATLNLTWCSRLAVLSDRLSD